MYVAIMESESFSWIAIGVREKQAKQAILDRWNKRQLLAKRSMKDLFGF